ncbi:MAG: flagellar hook-basal body protein FliE [Rhodospirillaceae bacterium]|jgi:flagellar hook-basal body complex protein FliE|nr:flagellar hook-basal body protein FliE [Rhodospirillales bacterium]MBT3906575.1 flagellar hook-basal body protein FliE [Rhodospirillaceae bacterium]MBT4700925.1 flagellar hook-basal body protein FliE [Rhodospirillaceae bacterium]MBT5033175.1 flagellar hook-basal body protein FliE [Rhodospirillaceae bacterium]MBT6219054.1 flagellar hook-basal body protein FliE [Rhodospirillaceae bacterium]
MVDPTQSFTGAVNAYANAAKPTSKSTEGLDARDNGTGDEFSELVKGALKQAAEIGREGEQKTLAGVTDKADLSSVVTAVAEAELTLQTVVAVRDKVIESYKQILRMPM